MAALKTCLLVSNDPDDHQILFEAIKEITDDVVLTVVMDGEHIFEMLKTKKIHPDYLIIDTEMDGIGPAFLKQILSVDGTSKIPLIIYTDREVNEKLLPGSVSLSKQLSYSEIKSRLKEILR